MTAQRRVRSRYAFESTAGETADGRFDARTRSDAGARLRVASRMAPLLIVLAAAQLLDLVTFAFAVERWGIQGELGPLGMVYSAGGYWAVAVVKVVMIAFVMLAMVSYRWRNPATPWRIGLVAGLVGAFGAATNVAALL